MAAKNKNNMEKIVEQIYTKTSVNICHKEFYKKLQNIDLENFAKSILNAVKTVIKKPVIQKKTIEDRIKDYSYWSRRQHVTYTQKGSLPITIEKLKIDSNEVFLERIIAYKKYYEYKQNKTKLPDFWNQYQVGTSYKEDVDIRIKENKTEKYVELKALNKDGCADNPLFAIVESIKNYYLTPNKQELKELIVLAPENYWEVSHNKDAVSVLKQLLIILSKHLGITISIQKINIRESDFEQIDYIFKHYIVNNLKNNKFKQNSAKKSKKPQYNYVISDIKLKNVFEEEALYMNKYIQKLFDWEQI